MEDPSDASQSNKFQSLIDNIRDEGVKEAEERAQRILTNAEKRAAQLLAEAHERADAIVSEARSTAQKTESAGHDALRRASRDVLLSLEETIVAQLDAVIHRETRTAIRGETLSVIVRKLVENWNFESEAAKIEVLVSEDDLKSLEEEGWHGLKEELLNGVHLRPVPGVEADLRIGEENGSVHYDFSAQTLSEWMGRFVRPRIREVLREVSQEKSKLQ